MQKVLWGTLQKVEDNDDGTITAYGIASSESRDSAGEIVTADAMRAAIPNYMLFPALREMHQLSAAGRTLELDVDDAGVTHIAALVVDDTAIKKVRTRTYAGFSIGGKVLKRDKDDPTIITALDLREVSLVDRPANASCALELWKADEAAIKGLDMDPNLEAAAASPETATPPASEADKASVTETAKADGSGNAPAAVAQADAAASAPTASATADSPAGEAPSAPVAKADDGYRTLGQRLLDALAKAGVIGKATVKDDGEVEVEPAAKAAAVIADAATAPQPETAKADSATSGEAETAKDDQAGPMVVKTVETRADGTKHYRYIPAEVYEAEQAAKADAPIEKTAAERAEEVVAALEKLAKGDQAEDVRKGMYEVSRFAEILSSLAYIARELDWEAEYEEDNSPVPARLRSWLSDGAAIFREMAAEEVNELIAYVTAQKTAKGEALSGQADAAADAKTAADPAPAPNASADALAKAAAEIDALKAAVAQRDEAFAALAGRMEKANAALAKRLEAVEAQPLPPKTAASATAVAKTQDSIAAAAPGAAPPSPDEVRKALAAMSDEERALLFIKGALANPVPLTIRPAIAV